MTSKGEHNNRRISVMWRTRTSISTWSGTKFHIATDGDREIFFCKQRIENLVSPWDLSEPDGNFVLLVGPHVEVDNNCRQERRQRYEYHVDAEERSCQTDMSCNTVVTTAIRLEFSGGSGVFILGEGALGWRHFHLGGGGTQLILSRWTTGYA